MRHSYIRGWYIFTQFEPIRDVFGAWRRSAVVEQCADLNLIVFGEYRGIRMAKE
jgi:hypothetical protein